MSLPVFHPTSEPFGKSATRQKRKSGTIAVQPSYRTSPFHSLILRVSPASSLAFSLAIRILLNSAIFLSSAQQTSHHESPVHPRTPLSPPLPGYDASSALFSPRHTIHPSRTSPAVDASRGWFAAEPNLARDAPSSSPTTRRRSEPHLNESYRRVKAYPY